MSFSDIEQKARAALAAAGQPIEGRLELDGKIHRYGASDSKAQWYAAFSVNGEHIALSFGDWRAASSHRWFSWEENDNDSATDAAELQRELDRKRQAKEKETERKTTKAAELAKTMWEHMPTKGQSPYLERKGVRAYGLRFGADDYGRFTVVPVRTLDNELKGLQRLYDDDSKRFLPGTAVKGNCYLIGAERIADIDASAELYLAEGYATAATVHEATGAPVMVCFDCGNLKAVADAIKASFPDLRLCVAADNDQWKANQQGPNGKPKGNAGIQAARDIERKHGARIAVPDFTNLVDADHSEAEGKGPTDFNDLAALSNLDTVQRQLAAPPPWTTGAEQKNTDELTQAKATIDTAITNAEQGDVGAPLEPDVIKALLVTREKYPADFARYWDKIKKANKGVPMGELDRQLRLASTEAAADTAKPILFAQDEPYPDAVDGVALLDELTATVGQHVACSLETARTAALWITFTWFIDVVEVAPLAVITAPEKRCGKSILLGVIGKLALRPLSSGSISAPALYRTIEAYQPTLLLDEADTYFDENNELRGIINCGHTRDSAFVIRCVGDDFTPTPFNTWCAKAIASIGKLADTLMDRAIVLALRRKLPSETVIRLRHADPDHWSTLRAKLARFANDKADTVKRARPDLPDSLNDRAQDNWEPLLSIADAAGSDWPAHARNAALHLTETAEPDSPSINIELLTDIKSIFERKGGCTRIFSSDLIEALTADDEAPWSTWNRGKPMSVRQLAARLREFGIKSGTVRNGYDTSKGYKLEDFTDAFRRYIPVVSNVTTSQLNKNKGLDQFSNVTQKTDVTDVKTPNTFISLYCDVVTYKNRDTWEI